MKLLLDANVSWRLAARLKMHFEACVHVDYIDLIVPAKDIEIWDYAQVTIAQLLPMMKIF